MVEDQPQPVVAGPSMIDVCGVKLELLRQGRGRPLLFLHSEIGLDRSAPIFGLFADAGVEVIAAAHPGFGKSERPRHLRSVDDLSYIYLDLIAQLDLRDVIVVGVSLGAWIAASIAIKSCDRIAQVVLAGPVGIKLSARDVPDIANIFTLSTEDYDALAFADPARFNRDYTGKSFDEVRELARNYDSTAVVAWLPYMHDPARRYHLHRVAAPTLLVHGAADQVVSPNYVRGFAALIPDAEMISLPKAGHYPDIEQPAALVEHVTAFAGVRAARAVDPALTHLS